jgi:signal transduction histidine kinase
VQVSDDGAGGARPEGGSGLHGLADRVASVGGALRIDSELGRGTRLEADLPCP